MTPTVADLARWDIETIGLLPYASNYSYLANLCVPGRDPLPQVVYKPRHGEAPLWDFPLGSLCLRETAAYLVSEAGGWNFVPPTVLVEGPLGIGAVQTYIEHDPRITAFEMFEDHLADLRQIVVFDLVVNNADRKAGHVLLDAAGGVWSVDHGICFHAEQKLRTVLWDFAGDPLTDNERAPVERLLKQLSGDLPAALSPLLDEDEIEALRARAQKVMRAKCFPAPGPGRSFPWPPV